VDHPDLYTTVTAWIGTVIWWRRAIRLGKAWARRLSLVINDAPAARRHALRAAVASPFFLVPLGVVIMW
jgi:hypothetical protein